MEVIHCFSYNCICYGYLLTNTNPMTVLLFVKVMGDYTLYFNIVLIMLIYNHCCITNHLLLLYIHCCIHAYDVFVVSLIHSSLLIVYTRKLLAKSSLWSRTNCTKNYFIWKKELWMLIWSDMYMMLGVKEWIVFLQWSYIHV